LPLTAVRILLLVAAPLVTAAIRVLGLLATLFLLSVGTLRLLVLILPPALVVV